MTVYSVTYDLRKEGQDYSGLIEKLETYEHFKYQQSAWLIKSNSTPKVIFESLKPFLDTNDYILIVEIENNLYGSLKKGSWDKISELFE